MLTSFLPSSVANVVRYRNLLYQLIRRDISSRYQGTLIGIGWSLMLPLLTLGVYALVFGFILQPRWPNVSDPAMFTVLLFSGLLVFNFFSECISRSASVIVSNPSYVKKVVFPVELLVIVPAGTGVFHMLLGISAWVILVMMLGGSVYWTLLLFPFVLLPLAVMCVGISYFTSAVGVYVRDIGQVIAVAVQLLMYLGPVIYPREVLPQSLQTLMVLNPITIPVEQFRKVMNYGEAPDIGALTAYFVAACVIAWAGRRFFDKTRHGFADVI
ncbi:ABC transporter permease [Pseudorhizobium flavum]|uniref:ABC transporter permease n=1 Tax=Pseudorhizobium flavum TaxID=1335061 RepID=UPI003770397C